jgi:paraquat-inducible protein A
MLATLAMPPTAPSAAASSSRLRECRDCGQFQLVPSLPPASRAFCLRCDAVLRHTHHDSLWTPLALNLTALILLLIAVPSTLMLVSTAGLVHAADMLTGPVGLDQHGLWELAAVVLFTTVAAPAAKLGCMLYVLIGLRLERPPRHLRAVFAWVEHLRPWSMIEVYLLGVFVAYVKLQALVFIEIGTALYALGALLLAMIAADVMLDAQFVWEEMDRRGITRTTTPAPGRPIIGCDTCGLVCDAAEANCPRCGYRLRHRKPNSIARTWALGVAAAMLYLPANVYPVLTVVQLGSGQPSTILGGARELLDGGQWPLALLVFVASIAVPMLKLVGLTLLLISIRARVRGHLRDRTVLFRFIDFIGRWSMIDIFMASILVALVQFGALVTINANVGAVAFASVVVLTMFAARTFDPRLMWDAAEAHVP